MPGPAQIISAATYSAGAIQWTTLATDLRPLRDTVVAKQGQPQPLAISALSATDMDAPPMEIINFITECSRGFARSQFENATVAAGTSFLDWKATVVLIEKFLQVIKQKGIPREGARFASTAGGFAAFP